MGKHLYELAESYRNISELLDDATIPQEAISEALAVVSGDLQAKAQNCAVMLQTLEQDAETLKTEEQRLAGKRRIIEGRRDWLKGYIKAQLEAIGVQKLKAGTFTLALQNNPPSVVIHDPTLIPAAYLTIIPQTTQVDKKAIAAAIKAGKEVAGATISQGTRLAIR